MNQLLTRMNAGAAFIWSRLPHYGARVSPSLGRMALDGQYLSGLPLAGAFLPIVTFLIGFAYAVFGKGDLPIYTANLYVLAVLIACAVLSGQMGLLAFFGYVLGDLIYFISYEQSEPSLAFPFAILLSWIFMFQLLVTFPYVSRQLSSFRGYLSGLNGLIAALFAAAFTELWTRLTMILLRPVFIWQGADIDLRLIGFGERRWIGSDADIHFVTWCALAAGLARWGLSPLLTRFFVAGQHTAEDLPQPLIKMDWPLSVKLALSSLVFTFMMSGVFPSFWGAALFAVFIYLLTLLRAVASGKAVVAQWDGWMRAVPTAIRLVVTYGISFVIAMLLVWLFRDTMEWRTMTTAAVGIALTIAVTLSFWPQVAKGETPPRFPAFLEKMLPALRPNAINMLLILCVLTAGPAFAHHCSFQPGCECLEDGTALAALIAASAVVGMLLLDQTAAGVAHDLHDATTGRDLFTGERLSWLDRGIAAIAAIPVIGAPADVLQKIRKVDNIRKSDVPSVAATNKLGDAGRSGRQSRLRELAKNDKLGSADRGWIKQELNSIDRGQRSAIRNPPGKDLAHERGRESAKGYDYRHSNLQDRTLHRLQHKYDDFGRANAERPLD